MSDCTKIENVINYWEAAGTVSAEEVTAISSHISDCAVCFHKYSNLLPLIRRDSGFETDVLYESPDYSPALTIKIMETIHADKKPGGRKSLKALFMLPAAAILVAVFGLTILPKLLNSSTGPGNTVVTFSLTAPEADSVVLLGDFNDWDIEGITLYDKDRDGVWEARVSLPKGNIYKYNFIINGELWITDPRSAAVIDDGFGGNTSLLQI